MESKKGSNCLEQILIDPKGKNAHQEMKYRKNKKDGKIADCEE